MARKTHDASHELRQLMNRVRAAGGEVSKTSRGRYLIKVGEGRIITVSGNPRDKRGLRNALSMLRSAGIDLRDR
jgi:hypothetical protein